MARSESEAITGRRQDAITAQYDRVAPYYRALSPLYLITPHARHKAVDALALRPGDTVLEVGAGTGRNLPYLVDAVGPAGAVIGVDLSTGMLRQAARMIARRRWSNVELINSNAATFELDREVDAVLFSLSYSAIPPETRAPAFARAWERLRPGGRVAIMDLGLTRTRLRPILDPISRLLVKLGPGDAYVYPWDDLAPYGEVVTEPFLLDLFYVCRLTKPPAS